MSRATVPLLGLAPPGGARSPFPVASLTPPDAIATRSPLPVVSSTPPPAPPRPVESGGAQGPVVQRLAGRSGVGALASAAASTVASTLNRVRHRGHPEGPPAPEEPLPEYTAIPAGEFDPRELSDVQLDELVHRIIGRITRLIRTELRMDRERIGKLRDPRH